MLTCQRQSALRPPWLHDAYDHAAPNVRELCEVHQHLGEGSESQSPCCRRFMSLALLELDRITTADRATPQHGGIDPDVDLIVLGRRAQDTRIPG